LPEIEAKAKTPAVQGTLKERPLPRLLQQLYRKQFTGHFVIADETRDESEVYLREGSPVHICRPVDTDRLDNILVEYGLVPSEVVAEASAQVSEKQRLGDVLERMGVLNKEKLSQVLKAQVTRKLTRLFFVAEGTYAVFICPHGFGQGGDLQLMRVDPRSVIYPGIRAAYDLPRVTRELSRLADQRFRLADISPGFVAALGVPPGDATIAALRQGWMTLDDLDAVTSRPFEVRSIVLAMYYTDSLERKTVASALGSDTDLVYSSSSSSAGGLPGVSSSPGGAYRVSRQSTESAAAFNLDVAAPAAAAKAANGSPSPPVLTPPPVVPVLVAPPPIPATGTDISLTPTSSPANASAVLRAPAPRPEPAPTPIPASAGPVPPPVVAPALRPPAVTPLVAAPGPAAPPAAPRPLRATPVAGVSALTSPPPSQGVPVVRAPFMSAMRPAAKPAPTLPAKPVAPTVPAKPAASSPAKPGTGPDGIRMAITDMAAKLEKATHFEILGVSMGASADEVGTAFVRAARQFHPDRLAGAGLADLQPVAERILARINEAAMVLGSPPRRAEYVDSLKAGAQSAQNLPTLLEAENQFLKGEVFLKKGDHAKAIEAFNAAVKNNPGEPQYQAYQAWARFEDPRSRKEVIVRETLKILEGVLRERPRFGRGHYWVGQLWKFLNESSKAEQAFREAVRVDESLIEASRELRLIEMRKNKAPPKPAKPESKGKFWKR
jgi:curved DNA-binding protein CbpA